MSIQQQGIGFLLADVARLMRKNFQKQLEGCSLTLAQARALIYISRNEGVRQIELAELLEIQPITLGRLVDVLAEAGYVHRRPDPNDRRAYLIFLLPDAQPQLAAIEKVASVIRGNLLQHFNEQQADQVYAALELMRTNLLSPQDVS